MPIQFIVIGIMNKLIYQNAIYVNGINNCIAFINKTKKIGRIKKIRKTARKIEVDLA